VRDGESTLPLAPVEPRVPSVDGDDDVHRLQRGRAVDPGVGEDDEEQRGVRDAERPAPRALADREDDVDDAEGDSGDLDRVQRPPPRRNVG
jgi:hypothetical protein